jgi:hypothetical protein
MIDRVFRAMDAEYGEAWEIGCWCHGTGQRFAEIAVDAMLAGLPSEVSDQEGER